MERLFQSCEITPKLKIKNNTSQTEANAKLDKSDIILLLGCMHFGSSGIDYQFLEGLTDFIKEHNLKFIMAGDDIDVFFSNFYSALPVHEQVLSPDEQLLFLESWLNEIGENLICSCWGNHELRIKHLTGLKIYDRLKSKFAIYFDSIGKLNLKVKDINYEIVLTHKSQGFSTFNPLHSNFNLARRVVDGDLFLTAHRHFTAIGQWPIREKLVTGIQIGSLKVDDEYSERYFKFGKGNVSFPAIYLSEKEKKIIPFYNIFDAINFRESNNGK